MQVEITKHAFSRAKERLAFKKKTLKRIAEKAFSGGLKHSETNGRLNRYVSSLFLEKREANNVRIYGEVVFLFSQNTLITVYQLPRHLRKRAIDLSHRKLWTKQYFYTRRKLN